MSGIYIHIPFCRKACHYCDFHFSTQHQVIDEMVEALDKEMVIRKHYLKSSKLDTVYFGGGTPSLLSEKQLATIFETIHHEFEFSPGAEITLESNPDDFTPENVAMWKRFGINRLSIGIQSFREEDLHWMNRAHNAEQALRSIELAKSAGIENITIDLIYGVPGLTDEAWLKNLETAFRSGVNHLSCYSLTVESRTALAAMIRQKKVADVDDMQSSRQFRLLIEQAEANGFEHYEISNFARDGKYSVHNTSYWKGAHYLGIGPSAHSFDGESRQWNVYNNQLYLKSMKENRVPFEREELTKKDKYNEYILTSLRTKWGIDLEVAKEKGGEIQVEKFSAITAKYVEEGMLNRNGSVFTLTTEGKLMADRMAAELFW